MIDAGPAFEEGAGTYEFKYINNFDALNTSMLMEHTAATFGNLKMLHKMQDILALHVVKS